MDGFIILGDEEALGQLAAHREWRRVPHTPPAVCSAWQTGVDRAASGIGSQKEAVASC